MSSVCEKLKLIMEFILIRLGTRMCSVLSTWQLHPCCCSSWHHVLPGTCHQHNTWEIQQRKGHMSTPQRKTDIQQMFSFLLPFYN